MNEAEIVAALDAIDGDDGEVAHGTADDLLMSAVSPAVAAAYGRVVLRAAFWACA